MINILYYVNGRLPSYKANGYQSSQMCVSFLKLKNISLQLLYQKRNKNVLAHINTDIKTHYNLGLDIPSSSIFCIDFVYYLEKLPSIFHIKILYILSEYLTTFSSLYSLYLTFKRSKTDFLYIRSNQVLISLGVFFSKRFINRIIFEVHDLNDSYLFRKLFLRYLNKVHSIITVTSFLKKELILQKINSSKILVKSDCVDLERFTANLTILEARHILRMNKHDIVIGFVGRLTTNGNEKGIPDIIKSAEHVFKKFKKIKFYFIGGNTAEITRYKKLIANLGLKKEIFVFIKNQHASKIPYYLWACDILLMPHPRTHFYSYNVSPLKLFEYMAARRPIIASRLPAICEILTHDVNSLLISPGNPKEIAESIMRLLSDSKLTNTLVKNAAFEIKNFTWDKRADDIVKFINR